MIKKILSENETLAYNPIAGFYDTGEMNISEEAPCDGTLRKCTASKFKENGLYVRTFPYKYQRDEIDKLLMMLRTKNSLLDFCNSTTIFNTMLNGNNIKNKVRRSVYQSTRVDAGRNQLSVDDCTDRAIKEQCKIVGNMFRDQVFKDLCIDESKKGEITLSILETEATNGLF